MLSPQTAIPSPVEQQYFALRVFNQYRAAQSTNWRIAHEITDSKSVRNNKFPSRYMNPQFIKHESMPNHHPAWRVVILARSAGPNHDAHLRCQGTRPSRSPGESRVPPVAGALQPREGFNRAGPGPHSPRLFLVPCCRATASSRSIRVSRNSCFLLSISSVSRSRASASCGEGPPRPLEPAKPPPLKNLEILLMAAIPARHPPTERSGQPGPREPPCAAHAVTALPQPTDSGGGTAPGGGAGPGAAPRRTSCRCPQPAPGRAAGGAGELRGAAAGSRAGPALRRRLRVCASPLLLSRVTEWQNAQ